MIHFPKFLEGNVLHNIYIPPKSAVRSIQYLFKFCNDIFDFGMIRGDTISYKTCNIDRLGEFSDLSDINQNLTKRNRKFLYYVDLH